MSPFNEFFAPRSVDEALGILQQKGSAACVLAGGTDVIGCTIRLSPVLSKVSNQEGFVE